MVDESVILSGSQNRTIDGGPVGGGDGSDAVTICAMADLPALAADAERWRFCARAGCVPVPLGPDSAWTLCWNTYRTPNAEHVGALVERQGAWHSAAVAIDAARAVVEPEEVERGEP